MQHVNSSRTETSTEFPRVPRVSKRYSVRHTEKSIQHKRWIIMACRKDEDVVRWILNSAESLRAKFTRVLWTTDDGPIRFFDSAEELCDYLSSGEVNV